MKSNVPFQLFACCIPVKGVSRSIVCDVQRKASAFIPNSLFEILTEHKGKTLDGVKAHFQNQYNETIDEYFQFLLDNEFIFFTESPSFYPKMELKWEEPAFVTNAIVDYHENSDYEMVFTELAQLGSKHLFLRFFKEISLESLNDIIELIPLGKILSLEILFPYSKTVNERTLAQLMEKFTFIFNATLFNAPKNEILTTSNQQPISLVENEMSIKDCGVIDTTYFTINRKLFTESQHHNTCLNRKISIDNEGNIKNCPSMSQSFGNIKDTTLTEALAHPDFKKYWNVTKDQISICKDCEFRHICTDCRAYVENPEDMYSKPLKCGYNPYTCEWEEWSTNPLKEKAIQHYGMEELINKVN